MSRELMPISVIVPTYRRPQPLLACVDSIMNGTLLPSEIVIVMRDSDTETEAVLPTIQAKCMPAAQVTVARVTVPGHIPPIVAGAKAASGELAAIVDDDVTVVPAWLESLARHFQDASVGLAGGRVIVPTSPLPKPKGKPGCVSWYGKVWGNIGAVDGAQSFEVDTVMECNWIWRRDLLRSLDFDDVLNFDDAVMYGLDLALQAKKRGYRVIFEPKALVYHHAAPRTPELDRKNRGPRAFCYARNCTYVVLKDSPWWRRPIFLAWAFLIGERSAWGLGALAADIVTRGPNQQRNISEAWRGRLEGIRLWRENAS